MEQDTAGGTPLEGEVMTPNDIRDRVLAVNKGFWPKFRKVVRRIPFASDLVAAYYCAMDEDTPIRVRATLLGALAYFILPVDGIPDVIAGLGFTDDAAVLAIALKMVASHMKPKHHERAQKVLADELPATGESAKTI